VRIAADRVGAVVGFVVDRDDLGNGHDQCRHHCRRSTMVCHVAGCGAGYRPAVTSTATASPERLTGSPRPARPNSPAKPGSGSSLTVKSVNARSVPSDTGGETLANLWQNDPE
jgi:hypothetical protein